MIGGGTTFISAVFCMWLCQFSCEIRLTEITTKSAFVLYISLYAIIFALVTIVSGRIWLGNGISMVLLFVVSMLDYQVYYFRGTEINPGDINSIRTALSVAGQYHPKITINLLIAIVLLIFYLVALRVFVGDIGSVRHEKQQMKVS